MSPSLNWLSPSSLYVSFQIIIINRLRQPWVIAQRRRNFLTPLIKNQWIAGASASGLNGAHFEGLVLLGHNRAR